MDIIFDLGNVLIAWDLHAGFADDFATEAELQAYLDRVGFAAWNHQADAGRPWAELIEDLSRRHGADAAPAIHYPARHRLTIAEPIEGTWALVDRLGARGHRLFALTNWSAETFGDALALHPRLDVFADIVVSGRERVAKPDPAIFRILLDRNRLRAADCVFIDDNAANVAAARDLGIDGIRFTDPAALERDLAMRGLL